MGNTATFVRGNPFTPFANTISLHLQLSTLINKLKTISRYICGTINSFTVCRLIINMLTMSSNFITSMHPAFKAVFGLVVYLFGGIPLTYAIRSTNYWLGFHKGLRLSTASEFCKNLRFQAHYSRRYMTYTDELQHTWCLGEQEGVQSTPLFLYALERTQYHIVQFLFTILLIGLLVVLTRHRSHHMTAPNTSGAQSGIVPAMRSTSIKRVGVNVFGLGHGSSWFGFLKQFFDRPSRKDVEAMIKKLAAEKDRVHMEDLAKAGKSFKIKLEAKEYEYRLLESSRDAEMKVVIEDLEEELKEQRQATLDAKMKMKKPSKITSSMRDGLACRDCQFHRQKLQEYEAGHAQKAAEVKQHDREEPKQAPSQRPEDQTPETKITRQPSPEEQALRQRVHKLKNQIKNATTSTKSQPKVDDKVAEELLKKQHNRNATLGAEILRLEGKINAMETGNTQADTYKAMLTYKANFTAQAVVLQRREQEIATVNKQLQQKEGDLHAKGAEIATLNKQLQQKEGDLHAKGAEIATLNKQLQQKEGDLHAKGAEIATLNEQLQQKEGDLHAKGAEMARAASIHIATVQRNLFYEAEQVKADTFCTELRDEHERERTGLEKRCAELEKRCEELGDQNAEKEGEHDCLDGQNEREKGIAKGNIIKLTKRYKAQYAQLETIARGKLDKLTQKNIAQVAQIDELGRRHVAQVAQFNELEERSQGQLQELTDRHGTFLDELEEEYKAQTDKLRTDFDELHTKYDELDAESTDVKTKSQKNIELLGQCVNQKVDLERQLRQERDTISVLHKRIGQLRNVTDDRMDETGDNTWAQMLAEAEMLLKTRDLQIRALERNVRVLERDGPGKTPVLLPQPRMMPPPRTLIIPSTSAASAISTVASNATTSDAGKGLDFAYLDEARVRKEVSSYVQTALESVTRWNKACFAGSVGAEKVVKNFATMLANWEYLQEDMIRDEKLLRAVKSVVGLEGRWTTAPTQAEIMGGKEPARDRMVKNAKRILAKIEGTGEAEGSKGVKRTR